MLEDNPLVKRMILLALEEDIGTGDLTTDAIVSPLARGKASLVAREDLVLAGLPVFKEVFNALSPEIDFENCFEDGDHVPAGQPVCILKGSLAIILKGERTALNFLQRMSGIATLTHKFVSKIFPLKVRLLDTRKTVPGFRFFDKYAVRMGGAFNHRFGLFDGILIKDNHIKAAGSITAAVEYMRKSVQHTLKIEVEVENIAGVKEALKAGVDAVLLDNMSLDEMRQAVDLVHGKVMLEASGGINMDNILDVAKTGVDLISVGALTHSAKAADFSLNIITQ